MKYERYTEKRNGKNVIPLRNAVCGVGLPKWSIEEHSDIQSFLSGEAVDRLAELEDKIEQGTLKEFALRVGDFLYQPIKETGLIAEWQILVICVRIEEGIVYLDDCVQEWTDKDICKKVFLTREEAEKRLKELQNG